MKASMGVAGTHFCAGSAWSSATAWSSAAALSVGTIAARPRPKAERRAVLCGTRFTRLGTTSNTASISVGASYAPAHARRGVLRIANGVKTQVATCLHGEVDKFRNYTQRTKPSAIASSRSGRRHAARLGCGAPTVNCVHMHGCVVYTTLQRLCSGMRPREGVALVGGWRVRDANASEAAVMCSVYLCICVSVWCGWWRCSWQSARLR